jgi:hypothetical protein
MADTNSIEALNISTVQQENDFKSLFNLHVCDLPTHSYLLSESLVRAGLGTLDSLISGFSA